jgi:peptidyl-prolyl cis-trans isomerase D
MATLERIRSKAGFLVTVVGIALFAFILGDLLRGGSTYSHQSKEKVAVVDGQPIGHLEFHNELETVMNNYKSRGTALSEAQQDQIRQMVFEQMVGSILLDNQSEKVGFVVSKAELTDLIMGDNISPVVKQIPYFQNPQTKAFDKNSLIQFLQLTQSDDWSMYSTEQQQQLQKEKENWATVEKNIKQQRLLDKFSTLLASAVVANSLDAKAAFNNNSVNVDFNYVSQLFTSIPDSSVTVSDAEISKLYEVRKQNYKQEAGKVVSYIAVNIVPSEADFADISARMDKLRDEFATSTNPADMINDNSDVPFLDAYISTAQLDNDEKNFVESASVGAIDGPVLKDRTYSMYKLLGTKESPDSIKINQINYPPSVDEAILKPRIDSLIQLIRSGKSFADIASAESNGQSNGDMGWQTEASLVGGVDVKFANALFDAKLNDLFTVKTTYGTHLVQVVEKTKPVKKYKVGAIRMEVTPSQDTYNKLYNNLNQYISKNHQLEQFKSAASEAGYVCQTGVQFLENQPNIASIENSRQVIRWTNAHKKGNISEIFECQNYFVAAAVEGDLKAGFRPLKDISDILKRELINEKKGAAIAEALKAKNISSLDGYSAAMNSPVQEVKFVTFATPRITGIGYDPIVNVKAVTSEVGQLTAPFAGKNAVYVLSLTAKNTSDQKYDEAAQKQQMNMQNGYRIMQMAQNNLLLKEKATIEDNRSRFY